MAVTYASFIAAFPEFSNSTIYPQAQVDLWITQAALQINAGRFGQSADLATMLFVAHNLVLGVQAARQAVAGGGAGFSAGVVSSKSVGPVSKSYDTSVGLIEGAGLYNLTLYGQRLAQMMRAFASWPVYVPGYPRSRGMGVRFLR